MTYFIFFHCCSCTNITATSPKQLNFIVGCLENSKFQEP